MSTQTKEEQLTVMINNQEMVPNGQDTYSAQLKELMLFGGEGVTKTQEADHIWLGTVWSLTKDVFKEETFKPNAG